MLQTYVPILVFFLVAAAFGLGCIAISAVLGPQRPNADKMDVYECGMTVEAGARRPFDIKYYLVAMSFLVFDVEVVFLYPWAVKAKALGLPGLIAMLIFLFIILVGFAYEWRKGALEWE